MDIHDISDPANPMGVAEYDLLESFPQIEDIGNIGSFAGSSITTQGQDHRRQGDREHVLWDAGYVTYDLADRSRRSTSANTSFDEPEPLIPR